MVLDWLVAYMWCIAAIYSFVWRGVGKSWRLKKSRVTSGDWTHEGIR